MAAEVTLPKRLLWNPSRAFDLGGEKRVRSPMRIVIQEAQSADDLASYLDSDLRIAHLTGARAAGLHGRSMGEPVPWGSRRRGLISSAVPQLRHSSPDTAHVVATLERGDP